MSPQALANPAAVLGPCHSCAKSTPPTDTVHLWDGHDYCRACLERGSPGLFEYAKAHPRFEDAIVYDRPAALREVITAGAFLLVGFIIVMAVLAAAAGGGRIMLVIVPALLSMWAFLMLFTWLRLGSGPRRMPRVRIADGQVEVFRPYHAAGHRPIVHYPLSEARWHLGRLREDADCHGRGGAIVGNMPAIILVTPSRLSGLLSTNRNAASGSTSEMRYRLVNFLRFAGVAEGR